MQKISPHLWYDTQAAEAADLYVDAFGEGRIKSRFLLHDTPSGTVEALTIELLGYELRLISAGPLFRFNPSISLQVRCDTADEVDRLWARLADGGTVRMELGSYPFSERYGWTDDRYGVSWQLMLGPQAGSGQRIVPVLLFVGDVCGKAQEAMDLYTSTFGAPPPSSVLRYGEGQEPDAAGTVQYASFHLFGQPFAAMDSARDHRFAFNEAVSLLVRCSNQEEIDAYWTALSAQPAAEQCGWLEDRFGVSWQIVPAAMEEMLAAGTPDQVARLTQAFLAMKKLDVAALEAAFRGGGPGAL